MVTCSICAVQNDEFAITCSGCKGFLQNRVPNLDLFATAWKILENPSRAFRQIRLAEHKNFMFFLHGLLGIALSFTCFWYLRVGEFFNTLLDVLIWGTVTGLIGGTVITLLFSLLYHRLVQLFGGKGGVRDSMALVGYSSVPIALSLVTILPIELMTFGMYLFTSNPSPYVLQPASFLLLAGLDILLLCWSLVLITRGTKIIHQISWIRSAVVMIFLLIGYGSLLFFVTPFFRGLADNAF